MPAVDVSESTLVKKGKVRLVVMGKPNSRKTSSFVTFPSPKVLSGCPGEKHSGILDNMEGVRVRPWEMTKGAGPRIEWNEYLTETKNILEGKILPGVKCVMFDGLHKAQAIAYAAGKAEGGDSFKGWEKGKANFLSWILEGYNSEVPIIIWTCWACAEKVDELSMETNPGKVAKGYYPDLIGKDQRELIGELPIVYQFIEGGKAYWQLQGDARAECGLRVPPDQATKLPYKVEADWSKLEAVLKEFKVLGASMESK